MANQSEESIFSEKNEKPKKSLDISLSESVL